MKAFVTRNTQTPLRGILSGTIATAVLQSSSLVGLLVLAFVGAKIMKLKDALLVIFGANLGTTATGWIVALVGFKFGLEAISLPLIATGGLVWTVSSSQRSGHYGRFVLGLGLLLFALQFMKTAVADSESLVSPEFFLQLSAWQYLLFGVLFSALVQSSSAAMVVTLSALYSGMVDLYAAAAVMIGADLGTTTTVMLGALRGSASKKRVALGHVLFNVITDAMAFVLLVPLVSLVALLGDPLMSLVAFHSLFNFIGIGLCTPFVAQFANFLEKRFKQSEPLVSKYLDPSMLEVVEVAVAALYKEVRHLAEKVSEQNANLFRVVDGKVPDKATYNRTYILSKRLEAEILEYSLDLDLKEASASVRNQIERFLSSARNLLLSSKLCKDNINDLNDLAEYLPTLFTQIVDIQNSFYNNFQEVGDAYGRLGLEQTEEFIKIARDGHDQIHETIYDLIKRDLLSPAHVSTALNVNRELYNSNLALLSALATLAGTEWAETDKALRKGELAYAI